MYIGQRYVLCEKFINMNQNIIILLYNQTCTLTFFNALLSIFTILKYLKNKINDLTNPAGILCIILFSHCLKKPSYRC